jgi:hypothetical protein
MHGNLPSRVCGVVVGFVACVVTSPAFASTHGLWSFLRRNIVIPGLTTR